MLAVFSLAYLLSVSSAPWNYRIRAVTLTHSLNSGSLSPKEAVDGPIKKAKKMNTKTLRRLSLPAVGSIVALTTASQVPW